VGELKFNKIYKPSNKVDFGVNMKKSRLVSLLALPVFSVATMTTSCNTPSRVYQEPQEYSNTLQQSQEYSNISQEKKKSSGIKAETVGAGVIEFLLGNPKTANLMNPTEQLAIGLVGNLLGIQGQRKHEIDYATAGKSQITINANNGRQAQLVRDRSGRVYIVMEGTIYPLSQEFINQAMGVPATSNLNTINTPVIEGATLPSYNLIDLESRFNSNPKENLSQFYKLPRGGQYISEIAKMFDVPYSNISWYEHPLIGRKGVFPIKNLRILQNRKKIRKWGKYHDTLWIDKERYKNEISAIFSYKWHGDLNHDGALSFNECNQIKRTFYDNENFYIGVKYQTRKGFKGNLEINILKDNTGESMTNEKVEIVSNGPVVSQKYISAGEIPIGTYVIHMNLERGINCYSPITESSATEKFEIIKAPETEKKK
jgi:hypothetical protein